MKIGRGVAGHGYLLRPSTRKETLAFTRYSTIRSPSTTPEKFSIQMLLMPRTEVAASRTACRAASSKLLLRLGDDLDDFHDATHGTLRVTGGRATVEGAILPRETEAGVRES